MDTNTNTDTQQLDACQVVMFTDIVGSTALYERFGDDEALRLIEETLELVVRISQFRNGKSVAQLGDEAMVMFTDPGDAAAAACDIHGQLAELRESSDNPAGKTVRIGMHYGNVLTSADAMLTETAKLAHWATSNAKAEQTLATKDLIDRLPTVFRSVSRYVDDETWDGGALTHIPIFEVIWDLGEATVFRVGEKTRAGASGYAKLIVSYHGEELIIDSDRPTITVGRAPENDLVIVHDLVSRHHMSLQLRRGRCALTDKSTNGSVVLPLGGERVSVRRDTTILEGSGQITLGQPSQPDPILVLLYECVAA